MNLKIVCQIDPGYTTGSILQTTAEFFQKIASDRISVGQADDFRSWVPNLFVFKPSYFFWKTGLLLNKFWRRFQTQIEC